MSKPTQKFVLPEQGAETAPISLLLREGAQKLVANAISAKFLQFQQYQAEASRLVEAPKKTGRTGEVTTREKFQL